MCKIGEDCNFEWNAKGSIFGQGMRGDFKDEKLSAFFFDTFYTTIQGHGVNSGHLAKFWSEFIYTVSDGSHETGFVASGAEHIPNHEASSGLAIGAGYSDDTKVFGREMVL